MNDGTTRREFLGSLAAFTLFPIEQEKPELILHNGHIVTMSAANPVAEAVAISRGRFLAVGKNTEVINLAAQGVRRLISVARPCFRASSTRTRTPRRPVSHIYAWSIATYVPSPPFRRRCASVRQKTPAGEWVLGFKYDDTKTEDGRPLSIADLDAAVPDHPAHIEHRGGHNCVRKFSWAAQSGNR